MSIFEEYLVKLEQNLPHISVDELKQWQEDKLEFILVDVRQAEEFLAGHIPGAINLPRPNLEQHIEERLTTPDQVIVINCSDRGRAQLSCHSLRDMGMDSSVLSGGFQAWMDADIDNAA